jgi:hypothetical protein
MFHCVIMNNEHKYDIIFFCVLEEGDVLLSQRKAMLRE